MNAKVFLNEASVCASLSRQRNARQIAFARALVWEFADWGGDRLFQRNATDKPLVQRRPTHAIAPTRSRKAVEVFASNRDSTQVASVFRALLKACGPTTVPRLVISSRIEAINRMIVTRPLAHVGQEGGEGIAPPRANADAARSVFREVLVANVGASPLHAEPDSIGRAGVAATLVAVLRNASSCHVTCIAESTK